MSLRAYLGNGWQARWGKPVVVENRPGADGLIGTAAFAAAQDDHVLLFSFAAPLSVYPVIQEKLSYDPVRDVLPVSVAVETFGTISVPASLPVTTLRRTCGICAGAAGSAQLVDRRRRFSHLDGGLY